MLAEPVKPIASEFNDIQIKSLIESAMNPSLAFFTVIKSNEGCLIKPLCEYESAKKILTEGESIYLGFADPCTLADHPGWPLRNLLSLVAYHWSKTRTHHNIVCVRISKDCSRGAGRQPQLGHQSVFRPYRGYSYAQVLWMGEK